MTDALELLRSGQAKRAVVCVCGEPLEVALVLAIRERGSSGKQLASRSLTLCAACAVDRMEIAARREA